MAEPSVLVVTSSGASPAAVVPVLAAIEAAGIRVRAIDVGSVGGGGSGVADRMRRAIAGEGAERKLRKELELSPPDAVVAFDPHAAQALTVVRDQLQNPAPVIAVVGDLDPAQIWSQSDADRFLAVDDIAAVALADAGVEGDRILVVGAIGERAFAEAAAHDRTMLRTRFKIGGKVALVEVAGLGAELTGQLSLQLSLLDANSQITFLFDAGSDADAAAVLRRQVPTLGLKAKLFGATGDAPLLWRAADVIVARPRAEVVSRVMLLGGRLVALVDDSVPNAARTAASLEARKRAISAKGLLMLSSALESAFGGSPPSATEDGADQIADIVAAVASDKRGVIDERLSAIHAATRDKVHRASVAAHAAAAATAAAGDLEDLGGGGGFADAVADLPDKAELERVRAEVAKRVADMTKQMAAARDAANAASEQAKAARGRGAADEAARLDKKADAERARMHSMLSELATLETELKDLEGASKSLGDIPRASSAGATSSSSSYGSSSSGSSGARAEAPPRVSSIDDELARLKRQGGAAPRPSGSSSSRPSASSSSGTKRPAEKTVDDELAALKKKMQNAPKKKP